MEDLKKYRHESGEKIKMYILVKKGLPRGHAINCAAHAAVACFKKFQGDPETEEWIESHFYKVTCRVSDEEFERFKSFEDHVVIREGNYNDEEMTMAFRPRLVYPPEFKELRLY